MCRVPNLTWRTDRGKVDTTKEGANNLAVLIREQELRTEVDTTKEGANNQESGGKRMQGIDKSQQL